MSEVSSLRVLEQHEQDCFKQDRPQRVKVASGKGLGCNLQGAS